MEMWRNPNLSSLETIYASHTLAKQEWFLYFSIETQWLVFHSTTSLSGPLLSVLPLISSLPLVYCSFSVFLRTCPLRTQCDRTHTLCGSIHTHSGKDHIHLGRTHHGLVFWGWNTKGYKFPTTLIGVWWKKQIGNRGKDI